VEAIRVLPVVRSGAVKAHAAALNTLIGMVRTGLEPRRARLGPLTDRALFEGPRPCDRAS